MASKTTVSLLSAVLRRSQRGSIPRPVFSTTTQRAFQSSSTTDDDYRPPFLQVIKDDLKKAMRSKDEARLSAVRNILSAYNRASKTPTPIRTDAQLVVAIRQIHKMTKEAAENAETAQRLDLLNKEKNELLILEEYLGKSGVETLSEAELKVLVRDAVEACRKAGSSGKSITGDVFKALVGPLEGKDVDRKAVAAMVKELAGQ